MDRQIRKALAFAAGFNVRGYPTVLDPDTHEEAIKQAESALREFCKRFALPYPSRHEEGSQMRRVSARTEARVLREEGR